MSVWTSSIPIDTTNSEHSHMFMIEINNDIWLVNNFYSTVDEQWRGSVEFFHFSTEYRKLFKVDIDFTFPDMSIEFVVAHDNQIMWLAENDYDSTVYTLNTTTKEVELVKKVGDLTGVRPMTIIDNLLYNLEFNHDSNEVRICTIDLEGRRRSKSQTVVTPIPEACDYHLSSVGNSLYLLEVDLMGKTRTVFKILDDEVQLVHRDVFSGNCETLCQVHNNWFDSFMILETGNDGHRQLHTEKFDFKSSIWIRQPCHPRDPKGQSYEALLTKDNMAYMVFKSMSKQCEIGILEQLPSLTKICILNAIEQIIKSGDLSQVDEFEKSLPDSLKYTASTMIHWRIKEHEDTDD